MPTHNAACIEKPSLIEDSSFPVDSSPDPSLGAPGQR